MRRAALERPRTLRTWRAHNRIIHEDLPTGCVCDDQPGRFRKGHAAGCSKPRCWICKSHKLIKEPTYQEFRAAMSYREWGVEFGFFVPTLHRR